MYKITVVTVCFNCEHTIKKTMESVLRQTYSDIEYILIDGASTDNTLSVIKSFKDDRIKYISEKDNGIYHAMNKAIKMATGEYIIFMNSGDCFANKDVLRKVFTFPVKDIMYGNSIRVFKEKKICERYRESRVWRILYLAYGRMVCHQSLIARTELLKKHPFDLNYKICADREFLAWATKLDLECLYLDYPVSMVDNTEGLSSDIKNKNTIRKETDRIIRTYYFPVFVMLYPCKFLMRCIEKRNAK